MPDLDDLHLLAPDVDTAVAARSFRQRRDRLRRRRHVVMGSAAVLAVAVVGAGSLALLSRDDSGGQTVVAGPPAGSASTTVPGPLTFEVLAVSVAIDPMGTVRAAVDAASIEELWSRSGSEDPVPAVDLSRVVVVSVTIPDDDCPPELVRFERDDELISPIFEEPPGGCDQPLIPKTFVVALDRWPLMPRFTLRLPADDTYGFAEQRLPVDVSSFTNADLVGPGEARPLAPAPLGGRSTMAAVWDGRQMFIWGGDGPSGQFDDGATYDPQSDSWTLLPASPLSARNAPAAVWTGEEFILWGGSASSGPHRDGAAYNPATQRWRSIAEAPFSSAGRPVGVWTGSEMIVLAGFNSRDAGAYNPATDTWRTLPELPGQLQAPNPVGIWANGEVVTVIHSPRGIANRIGADVTESELADLTQSGPPRLVSLRPDSDEWSNEGDLPRGQTVLASTDDGLLVAAGSESFHLVGGDRSEIAVAPEGVAVGDTASVWTGTELLLWEGDVASAIDPLARTWLTIPAGESSRRAQPAVVWADGVLIAWGGFPDEDSGLLLRPAAPGTPTSQWP